MGVIPCITFSGQTPQIHNPDAVFSNKEPTPSKVAVLTFYLSIIFCVIGSIVVVGGFFLDNVSKVSFTKNIKDRCNPFDSAP
jgi:hypothetical protein